MSTNKTNIIAAMGTPLSETETLHVEGFEKHVEDVAGGGIDAALVGGSMGNMQLLSDETYQHLMKQADKFCSGKLELFVGAGDASFARTRDRLRWLKNENISCDGVALLTPYFVPFSQKELIDYFSALADEAHRPIFLYDLPVRCGVALEIKTVLRLAEHPNIAGIKCSGAIDLAQHLRDQCPENFRVLVAKPMLLDILIHGRLPEHVDGMYALAPQWTQQTRSAAATGQMEKAHEVQKKLSGLLDLLIEFGIMPAFTALMNQRGIPGNFFTKPIAPLPQSAREELLSRPLAKELCSQSAVAV